MAKYDVRKIKRALKEHGYPVESVVNCTGSCYGNISIYMKHDHGRPLITTEASIQAKMIASEVGQISIDKIFCQY